MKKFENYKKYLPIISGLFVTLAAFSKQVSPYINGFNLAFVLVIFAYIDWHMGIEWRRHQGKKVLSGWSLVKRLARKMFGSLLPFIFELSGYIFGMFVLYFDKYVPFADIPLDTTRFLFSWLAIASFIAIAYDSLLSMVANWWLAGHVLPDNFYDWCRDEILEKMHRTEDSKPFNNGGNDNDTI